MKNTTAWQIPYPESGDHTRTWEYWQGIADKVDQIFTTFKTALNTLPTIQLGTFTGGPSSQAQIATSVTFPKAFLQAPIVVTNNTTSAAGGVKWISRAYSITPTGFNYYLVAADGITATWSALQQWTAMIKDPVMPLLTATETASSVEPAPQGWHNVSAVCANPACENYRIEVPGILIPDAPDDIGWTGIICGACSQPIAG